MLKRVIIFTIVFSFILSCSSANNPNGVSPGDLDEEPSIEELQRHVDYNRERLEALILAIDNSSNFNSGQTTTVYFDPGIASLRFGSTAKLERLAEALKSSSRLRLVEIHGHSDDFGSLKTRMSISEARARSVAAFLSNHGVPAELLHIISHGSEMAILGNKTNIGRQFNRRVEVVPFK